MDRKPRRRSSSPERRRSKSPKGSKAQQGQKNRHQSQRKDRPRISDQETKRSKSKRKVIPNPSRTNVEPTIDDQNRDDLIFGRHTVIAAIENERPLNKIWVLPQLKRNEKLAHLLAASKSRGAVIDETTSLRLDQLTQYATHQGIVAQVGACSYVELDELVKQAQEITSSPVLVAVDGITDPHNLGAIIRSAEALGAQGIILPQRRAASVGATVAKVAAGALELLPISRVVNLNQALETLKKEGYWIYGLTLDAPSDISNVELSGAIVLLIGSEGKGLSAVSQKHCDGTIKIPLAGQTQSLNASVAAGIGIYEIFRQRLHPKL